MKRKMASGEQHQKEMAERKQRRESRSERVRRNYEPPTEKGRVVGEPDDPYEAAAIEAAEERRQARAERNLKYQSRRLG